MPGLTETPSLVLSISNFSVLWLRQWARPQLKMNVRNVKNSQRAGMRPCSEGGWADPLNEQVSWKIEYVYWPTKLPREKLVFTLPFMSALSLSVISPWLTMQLEDGDCCYQQDVAHHSQWTCDNGGAFGEHDVFSLCAISNTCAYCTNGLCNKNLK